MKNSDENALMGLLSFLSGRALLLEEIQRQFPNIPRTKLQAQLRSLSDQGFIELRCGVEARRKPSRFGKAKRDWVCLRCGSEASVFSFDCASCHKKCYYCERCLAMGRSRSCEWYVFGPAIPSRLTDKKAACPLHWDGKLSLPQQKASEQIVQFLSSARREQLVWAVCGSGKTEMIFQPLNGVLQNGRRVLIATPRKDVVFELLPRLMQAFPQSKVIGLYKESEDKWQDADITIATTHQVLRFYRRFDVVVLDEMDAFPYHHNPMLEYGVRRSLKKSGKLIYLTATPPRDILRQVRRGKLPCVTVPARFHGRPLPVPNIRVEPGWEKKFSQGKRIETFHCFIRNVEENDKQAFLFVPSIRMVDLVQSFLDKQRLNRSLTVDGTHSQDKARIDKVRRFRAGQTRILVTTTILERGVTVPRLDVMVIGADTSWFDEASLVQMAGRVGRSPEDWNGKIWFLAEARTRALSKAVRQIREMNRLAAKEGFISNA